MSGAIMNKIWGAFGMDANEEEEEDYVENNEEMEEEEENTQEPLPGAVESALPEFSDVPQTGDNAISNMGDEAYLKKIEEEEEKENNRIAKEKEEGTTDDEN